jgi:hypothetical protein
MTWRIVGMVWLVVVWGLGGGARAAEVGKSRPAEAKKVVEKKVAVIRQSPVRLLPKCDRPCMDKLQAEQLEAQVIDANGVVHEASVEALDGEQIVVSYPASVVSPRTALITNPQDQKTAAFPISGEGQNIRRRAMIRGDFTEASTSCASGTSGFVNAVDGASADLGEIVFSDRVVNITFDAPVTFQPYTLFFRCGSENFSFPYVVYEGDVTRTHIFIDPGLKQFCSSTCTLPPEIQLQPAEQGAKAKAVWMTPSRIAVEVTGAITYVPQAIVAKSTDKQVVARRSLGVVLDSRKTNVSFTVIDSETAKRNFFKRISNNYHVINLELHNPTNKKLQLNKSALWFDVDYAEGIDLFSNNPKLKSDGKRFLFGIDHTQRHTPHTFTQVLASFDAQTGKEKTIFDGIEVAGAIMTGLVTTVDSENFSTAVRLLTGILIPGVRNAVMNPEEINRKRANMIAQGLQNIVQIPPRSSISTVVFLPRKGILALMDTSDSASTTMVPVIITLIRDVHMDLEVVAEVTEELVAPGIVRSGYTMDQVLQALGGKFISQTDTSGRTSWSFPEGPVKRVVFGKDDTVSDFEPRPIAERLVAGTTKLADVKSWLGESSSLRKATDGGFIWLAAPEVHRDLRFDDSGTLMAEYQEAYRKLKPYEGRSREEFVPAITEAALSDDRKAAIEQKLQEAGNPIFLPSPDIVDEVWEVTWGDGKDPNVKSITVLGGRKLEIQE